MSFINWGSESREQLRIRKRLEEDYLQAVFEQRAANAAATASAAGSGGVEKSSLIVVIDSGWNFYRLDYVTGEWTPLSAVRERPAGITAVLGAVTDSASGDIWLSVTDNPCYPSLCFAEPRIIRVTVDGDTVSWGDLIETDSVAGGTSFAWNSDDLSIIRTEVPMVTPIDLGGVNIVRMDTQTGESLVVSEIAYSQDMMFPRIISSKSKGWVWILFIQAGEADPEEVQYYLFHLDLSTGGATVLPEDCIQFTLDKTINRVTLDNATGLFVGTSGGKGGSLALISSFNSDGIISSILDELRVVTITDLI
jgi:hypothetical protein